MTDIFQKSHHTSKMEYFNFGRLNYEEERIKSFSSWPVHFPVDPSRLAKAGFYFTGNEDEVVCFSCKGHIKNWTYGDIVLKKHADLYPDCDFIKNQSNNVPLRRAVSKSTDSSIIIENVDKFNSNCSDSESVDFAKMKSEKERLKSYCAKWPVSFINISDLAHAGFFYTGVGNTVQCPYCKGKISRWEPGHIPFQEHLKYFPWCDYLSQNISKLRKGPSGFQSPAEDVCGNMKCPDLNTSSNKLIDDGNSLEDLGVHLHKGPVHPQQASLSARLRSFSSWPSDAAVSQEDLAAAGFFYIGINDRTTCFYCNGGLCSWEQGDDPWVEHARWFSSCDFLRLNKGMDFVKSCVAKNSSPAPKESIPQESSGIEYVEPLLKKVDEAMKCNLVKYILETDLFPVYIVRAAILLQIKKTGHSFANMDELCVAVSYLKDEMEKESLQVKPIDAKELNICKNISSSCTISNESDAAADITNMSPSSSNSNESQKSVKNGYSEKRHSLEEDGSKDHCLCKICMENEIGVVFLPCGHLHACTVCAPALKFCPMCRKAIQATVRVYIDL